MTNEYLRPDNLERYSFLWSEARLIIAALALLLGGVPPLKLFLPLPSGLMNLILTLCWLISGVAAGYLLYHWFKNNKLIFGGNNGKDKAAFLVSVVSGINLGLVGLTGRNIGMSITSNYLAFLVVAVLYILAAYHLYKRFKFYGEKLF